MRWFNTAISLIFAAAMAGAASAAETTPVPSAAEVEFWRSTERLGTPDAYRAYLAAFPGGLYAPLARAALGAPAAAPGAAPATAPTAPAPARPGAMLRYFVEEPDDTSAISFRIGERFSGPGALTLGRLGARKQIVLPEGEWVVLAGADWRTLVGNNQSISGTQVSMSTVVFGKFADNRLVTMLRFSADTRPIQVTTWPDVDRCGTPGSPRLFLERTRPDAFRDECVSVSVSPDPLAERWPGNEEARRNIARLGGTVGGTALVTVQTFGERRWGYLGVTRLDWPGYALGPEADRLDAWQPDEIARVPARRGFVRSLTDWAAVYRKAALEGYRRDWPDAELTPVVTSR